MKRATRAASGTWRDLVVGKPRVAVVLIESSGYIRDGIAVGRSRSGGAEDGFGGGDWW